MPRAIPACACSTASRMPLGNWTPCGGIKCLASTTRMVNTPERGTGAAPDSSPDRCGSVDAAFGSGVAGVEGGFDECAAGVEWCELRPLATSFSSVRFAG